MDFTQEHKIFLIESYFRNGRQIDGEWVYSKQDCLLDFQENFPQFPIAERNRFFQFLQSLITKFRETGSVSRRKGSGRKTTRTEEVVEQTRQIVQETPSTSLRHLSQEIGVSVGTCAKILKKDLHMHPYRLTATQELLPLDLPQRLQFGQWFLNTFQGNEDAFDKVFFSDEAWFHLSGYVNSQNMRYWSAENPHFFIETPLHPQKIGVWAAISKRRIVGPIFFQGTITALRYREEILTPFINELFDDEIQAGYFQQDGATAHVTQENLNFLQEFFANRLISRNNEIFWPPRSCDLTPCDFFLWPHIKNNVYKTPARNLEELQQRIVGVIEDINNSPNTLTNVFRSVITRITACIEQQGGHIF